MKQRVIILLLFVSSTSFAQHKSFDSAWIRSLERNFTPTDAIANDSCYFSHCLLKIDLNKYSQITSIQFSDNADSLIKEVFVKIIKKGDKINRVLENDAKKANIKNVTLILPVLISCWGSCPRFIKETLFNERLYIFKGERLAGRCIFLNPFAMLIGESNTKSSHAPVRVFTEPKE